MPGGDLGEDFLTARLVVGSLLGEGVGDSIGDGVGVGDIWGVANPEGAVDMEASSV